MVFKSFSDLNADIFSNLSKIPKNIDLIVGVPRSGLLLANMIALILNKPITDVNGIGEQRIISMGRTKNVGNNLEFCNLHTILVVEDSINTGKSFSEVRRIIQALDLDCRVIYLAAYVTKEHAKDVDIYFEVLNPPRVFEWNIFHHRMLLGKACFDMDGVLCEDPTAEQNDDGEQYRAFLQNAAPKILPSAAIGCIVTSRLEKYRELTETWLREHGVEYRELVMLDATAEERKSLGLHAIFKADVYKRKEAMLFVESSARQAEEIFELTKKPVYCIENNRFYDGSAGYKLQYETKLKLRRALSKSRLLKAAYQKLKQKRQGR